MQLHKVAISVLVLMALQSLVDLNLFHNCPLCSWSCDLHIEYLIIANHCSCWVVSIVSIWFQASEGSQGILFYGMGLSAPCPTPDLEDQGIPFSLGHHLDLSGMGDPTSSYATASIAVRNI
jgi:hypothetical protein